MCVTLHETINRHKDSKFQGEKKLKGLPSSNAEVMERVQALPVELRKIIYEFDPTFRRNCFSQVIKEIHKLKEHCPKCDRIAYNGFSYASSCSFCSQNTKPVYWCQSCKFRWCSPQVAEVKKYRKTVSEYLACLSFLERKKQSKRQNTWCNLPSEK
tara:strand:- start:2475 stop:2942 length:468 start_codon:yes stop_codon:yes gene_type:complete